MEDAYDVFSERGIWEEMRDEAWSGVRGGVEGRERRRESWSRGLLWVLVVKGRVRWLGIEGDDVGVGVGL